MLSKFPVFNHIAILLVIYTVQYQTKKENNIKTDLSKDNMNLTIDVMTTACFYQ